MPNTDTRTNAVTCPTCDAKPGEECSGAVYALKDATGHNARIRLAGATRPERRP